MRTCIVSKQSRDALRLAAGLAAIAVLAGCGRGGVTPDPTTAASSSSSSSSGSSSGSSGSSGGSSGSSGGSTSSSGGGTTMTASPYILYASNYVVFPGETNGSYLASIQGGNVYAGSSAPDVAYGNYSATPSDINATQFYNIQWKWTVAGGGSKDYAYVSINVPGSGPTYTALTPLDISQAGNLLIQMGNTYTQSDNPAGTVGGNATVFTVVLNNDTSAKQDGSQSTANCVYYQTLVTVGRNSTTGIATPLGVYNYEIPLSAFTNCPLGSIATLQSTGITTIAVRIDGSQNKNLVANELDTIAVGYVGFTM